MTFYSDTVKARLKVNGELREVIFEPSDTLARVIREQLGLTGTKTSCENGDCGGCTVQVDDVAIKSCLMLAVEAIGKRITTIEGIQNHRLKDAFTRHNGFQCGYCTPGMIVNADAMLKKTPCPDKEQLTEHLQSNLCRCTGYEGIESALKSICKPG